jgi:hypothetical protein
MKWGWRVVSKEVVLVAKSTPKLKDSMTIYVIMREKGHFIDHMCMHFCECRFISVILYLIQCQRCECEYGMCV